MELSLFWHWSPHLLIAISNIKRKSRDIKTCWERWHRKASSSWLNQPPREARRAWRRISAACQSEEWVWHSGPDCPSLFLLPLFVGGAEIHWQRHQELHSEDSLSINSSTLLPQRDAGSPPAQSHWIHASCISDYCKSDGRGETRRGEDDSTGLSLGAKSKAVKQHPGIIRVSFCLRACLVCYVTSDHWWAETEPQCRRPGMQLINLC